VKEAPESFDAHSSLALFNQELNHFEEARSLLTHLTS
jgi:hypothetical protein